MGKLDINSLLAASLKGKGEAIQEGCTGCGSDTSKFNLNLEAVAHEERVAEFISEEMVANMRAAIATGLAANTVLEARILSRIEEATA
jgi:argininosuccinate synthase